MAQTLKTTWAGGAKGEGCITSDTLDVALALPTQYGGTGAGANPKELLTGAAAACFMMTLATMLEGRRLPVAEMALASTVDEVEGGALRIEHVLTLVLAAGATAEQVGKAEALIPVAEERCPVEQLLKSAGVQFSTTGTVSVAAA